MDTTIIGNQGALLEQHAQQLESSTSSIKRSFEASSSASTFPHKKTLCSSSTTGQLTLVTPKKKGNTEKSSSSSSAAATVRSSEVQASSFSAVQPAGNVSDSSILELVETYGIICDASKLSIATVIKRKAILVHDRYKNSYFCR